VSSRYQTHLKHILIHFKTVLHYFIGPDTPCYAAPCFIPHFPCTGPWAGRATHRYAHSLGLNPDPAINCHPAVSQAGSFMNVPRRDVELGFPVFLLWLVDIKDLMVSFFMVRVVGLGSKDPEFKSHSAIELIPGRVDSACRPSEVGKMSATMLVTCVGVATRPRLCPITKETVEAAPTLCI